MVSKKQAKLIKKISARLPEGADRHFDAKTIISQLEKVKYLSYVDMDNNERIVPISDEELSFIMRESDLSTYYARTFPDGEKLFLVFDSKSDPLPKEIQMNYPYRRLSASKGYTSKALEICPKDYSFIWDK